MVPSAQSGVQRFSHSVPAAAADVAPQDDQCRFSSPIPPSAHAITMLGGSVDSCVCVGAGPSQSASTWVAGAAAAALRVPPVVPFVPVPVPVDVPAPVLVAMPVLDPVEAPALDVVPVAVTGGVAESDGGTLSPGVGGGVVRVVGGVAGIIGSAPVAPPAAPAEPEWEVVARAGLPLVSTAADPLAAATIATSTIDATHTDLRRITRWYGRTTCSGYAPARRAGSRRVSVPRCRLRLTRLARLRLAPGVHVQLDQLLGVDAAERDRSEPLLEEPADPSRPLPGGLDPHV